MPNDGKKPAGAPLPFVVAGVLEGRPSAGLAIQFGATQPNKTHLYFWMAVGDAGLYEVAARVEGSGTTAVYVWRIAGTAVNIPAEGFSQPAWDYARLGLEMSSATLVDGTTLRDEIETLLASGTVQHASVAGLPYTPSKIPPPAGLGLDNTHYNYDRYPMRDVDGGMIFYTRGGEGDGWKTIAYYVQLRAPVPAPAP